MYIDRYKGWNVADLPWHQFDAALVDPELLKIAKAAALVEYNAGDYATYLCNVFPDDAAFCSDIRKWAEEETQHGAALGAWAERADPGFSFDAAFARYTAGYRINVEVDKSIRGSRAGELIARCIVETGTSSYYATLGNAAGEPVLKALCGHIAADELRHYKLFNTYLAKYVSQENLSRFKRLRIGLGRVQESEDDELAYAFFAANAPANAVYSREHYSAAYMARAFPLYKPDTVERIVAMVFRSCGFVLSNFTRKLIRRIAHAAITLKARRAISLDNQNHLYAEERELSATGVKTF